MQDELMRELKQIIIEQGDAWLDFKAKNDQILSDIRADVDFALKRSGRPNLLGGDSGPEAKPTETWIDTKTQRPIHVLAHGDSLAALEQKAGTDVPSVGRLLRGITLGGRAADAAVLADERKALGINPDPSGGYTVGGALSAQWVDALRAQMVLSKAGARTLPMEAGSVSIARVNADPEVFWHAENAPLQAGDPTFGAVNLNAKTVACLVRMSLELSQDSANIEQMLQSTIVNAMAGAIDRAGLVGTATDAALAPSGVFGMAGRNVVESIGAPANYDFVIDGLGELMADNVPLESVGALIGHPSLWKKLAKLKTGITSDETSLSAPADVARLPKLWTTGAPTDKAVIADWRDLIMGVRQQISVRVLSEQFMGSNLQIAVLAYARVDFAGVRPQSFCTLEGITV